MLYIFGRIYKKFSLKFLFVLPSYLKANCPAITKAKNQILDYKTKALCFRGKKFNKYITESGLCYYQYFLP